mmetsp:Transcript_65167/g.146398  ORF Transcript_65167/g.146398 Transcript_65167/m.146398 type:complete len:205 (+) Transcript_65167:75-689(+)
MAEYDWARTFTSATLALGSVTNTFGLYSDISHRQRAPPYAYVCFQVLIISMGALMALIGIQSSDWPLGEVVHPIMQKRIQGKLRWLHNRAAGWVILQFNHIFVHLFLKQCVCVMYDPAPESPFRYCPGYEFLHAEKFMWSMREHIQLLHGAFYFRHRLLMWIELQSRLTCWVVFIICIIDFSVATFSMFAKVAKLVIAKQVNRK